MAENFLFGQTDTGKVRDNNEDTFIAQFILNQRHILACVIDGVGGYHGGEIAAAIAKDEILETFGNSNGDLTADMIAAFKQASAKIHAEKQLNSELDHMACVATLVVADVQNNHFVYAHVGDTRLYLLRDGSLVKISKDHSFVGYLEDSGRLTEAAAMNHPKRNEINKALGFTEEIETDETYIETGESPFLPGDMLLLCSDGLTDMVDKKDITRIITTDNSLEQKAAQLIDAANKNGGNDNITVVLVKNYKAPRQVDATKPPSTKKEEIDTAASHTTPSNSLIDDALPNNTQRRQGNGLSLLLGILCLTLLATSVWLFMQWKKDKPSAGTEEIKPERNDQELLLQDAFDNARGDTLVLSDSIFKSPIIITDTLFIRADSMYIKAKGSIVLQRDTAYHGPALFIAPTAKLTVLESLQFNDFPTAIYLNNTALILKNTQFIGSLSPVVNRYSFSGRSAVTARIPVLTIPADSVTIRTPPADGQR